MQVQLKPQQLPRPALYRQPQSIPRSIVPSNPIYISYLVQAILTIAGDFVEEHVTHLVQNRSSESKAALVVCADADEENSPDGVEVRETPVPEVLIPLDHDWDSAA